MGIKFCLISLGKITIKSLRWSIGWQRRNKNNLELKKSKVYFLVTEEIFFILVVCSSLTSCGSPYKRVQNQNRNRIGIYNFFLIFLCTNTPRYLHENEKYVETKIIFLWCLDLGELGVFFMDFFVETRTRNLHELSWN